jgi:hypothetical protein
MTAPAFVAPDAERLRLYLGKDAIDTARAALLIAETIAQALDVVTPLPASASSVVLQVAARAYANPVGVRSQTTGPFSVSNDAGGVYLTKQDRAALRRGAGRGAFSIDTLPATAGNNLDGWDIAGSISGYVDPMTGMTS